MGFWVFMLAMDLLLPLTMLGFGSYFAKKAPSKINYAFGYRTPMSMKNKDTWEFAHRHIGKVWRGVGWVLLPLSAAAMCLALGKDTGAVGIFGSVLMGVQLLVLLGSIIPTERALKKNFDENGKRR